MLCNQDIVILTYADWFAVKSSPQHVSRLLARRNRVLLVDVPRSFLRFLKPDDPLGGDHWEGPRMREVLPNLTVFHPPQHFLPVGGLPFSVARKTLLLNGYLLAHQIRKAMRRLGFNRPLLWTFSPLHGGAVRHLPRRLHIHDICDEWSNYLKHPGGRRLVEWIDCRLTKEADIVFVFSQHMHSRRATLNPETHVVLPAGDVAFYGRAAAAETVVPKELEAIARPIVGAICVIEPARFDLPLVESLARKRPEWSFVFLGPTRPGIDLTRLECLPNVHLLGNPSREMLPDYLKGFDVALVPYALNDATRGIYPMKLQEYLAGGKPVVCPPLPECLHLEPVVHFAGNPEAFEEAIAQEIAQEIARENTGASAERARARIEVAQANSWEQRMQVREMHVQRLLDQTGFTEHDPSIAPAARLGH